MKEKKRFDSLFIHIDEFYGLPLEGSKGYPKWMFSSMLPYKLLVKSMTTAKNDRL